MSTEATFLTGRAALNDLRQRADATEKSRSEYWELEIPNFSVDETGQFLGISAAGNVSRKSGLFYDAAHWLLQAPWRRWGKAYPNFNRYQALGHLIARRQGRQYTEDIVRQVLTISLVASHIDLSRGEAVSCVIGDGYGVLSALLLLAHPGRKVVIVNLRKTLMADMAFLAQAAPDAKIALARTPDEMRSCLEDDSVSAIAVEADNAYLIALAPIGAAFNLCSMQEMNPEVIADYFSYLRASASDRTAFYCCNRVHKTLPRGTVTEFDKYPWQKNDEIVFDEICPWLKMYYSPRPPFWHKKPASSFCRHRLSNLACSVP